MVNDIVFNLKSPATLAPNRSVGLCFEVLKSGLDFSSLAMQGGIFFEQKIVLLTFNICCLVWSLP